MATTDRPGNAACDPSNGRLTAALNGGIPKLRWGIGLLLGMGVLINYFDRISLSVAAPQLQLEFGLSEDQLVLRVADIAGFGLDRSSRTESPTGHRITAESVT